MYYNNRIDVKGRRLAPEWHFEFGGVVYKITGDVKSLYLGNGCGYEVVQSIPVFNKASEKSHIWEVTTLFTNSKINECKKFVLNFHKNKWQNYYSVDLKKQQT